VVVAYLNLSRERISAGSACLDMILHGGFAKGEITLLYGEAATGKTTTILQSAVSAAKLGLKVFYVDSDHSFTEQRFHQIAGPSFQLVSELVMLFLPETFAEQRSIIESLENYLSPKLGVVIIDSISSLYRASFSNTENVFTLNRDLSRQLAYLSELSSTHNLVCILTSQVHARLALPVGDIEPVARRALFHFPKTILRLNNTPRSAVKEFRLERLHGSDAAESRLVALRETGVENADS
jgi:RecA/RadA recombinase